MSITQSDKHYWKQRYKEQWDKAQQKEEKIKSIIEKRTGYKVKYHGLGAGKSKFISGSAADHGEIKGDADLIIKELLRKLILRSK